MRVVFYTSGTTGSGRIVRGISIGNAIRRANTGWDYTILSLSPFAPLADILGHRHVELPPEDEDRLSEASCRSSALYDAIASLQPDVLLVDLLWFPMYHFIRDLKCKKIFLCHNVAESFFQIPLKDKTLYFRYDDYDRLIAIEPFKTRLPFDPINPLVIRNHDELLPREQALTGLGLDGNGRNCLIAINARPGDFERIRAKYAHLESDGYRMVFSSNYHDGLFPAVDYFNAVDLVVCNASYNQYWEVRFFNKEAVIEPIQGRFTSGAERMKFGKGFLFTVNGADQLVDVIMNL